MVNHRAVKHAGRRRHPQSSVEPTGPAATTAGKRKAVKPGRAARTEVPAPVLERGTPFVKVHAVPASSHVGGRKKLFRVLPSGPAAAGVAALALAAAGAVTAGQAGTDSPLAASGLQRLSAQANVLNGASGISSSSATSVRERSISRDSQRDALADAAEKELIAAAEAQAKERNAAIVALRASAEKHASIIAENAWGLPLPEGVYRLSATFGQSSGLWARTHTGLDFAAPSGTPILSVANGVVTETGYAGSYGNRTIITLDDGTELWYCHQLEFGVETGDTVTGGETIGYVGTTGNSTGPHLHLEVRPGAGDPVDPFTALVAHGVTP